MEDNTLNYKWNAEEWLLRFDEAKRTGRTRQLRAEVFQSTVDIIKHGEYKKIDFLPPIPLRGAVLNPDAINSNIFYNSEIDQIKVDRPRATDIKVLNKDCLECAQALCNFGDYNVCVLNMASGSNPGGGVINGAGAQEEYLFRCTDYYRFLFQYAKDFSPQEYGITPNPNHRYPLDNNFGGIYSSNVTVFRAPENDGYDLIFRPWWVNMIAVPAVNLKHQKMSEEEYTTTMLNKIRTIFRIAYVNGERSLVLGAFGCGAFGNNPYIVAALFKQVLNEQEFHGAFNEVFFAITEDHNSQGHNFKAFAEVFGKQVKFDFEDCLKLAKEYLVTKERITNQENMYWFCISELRPDGHLNDFRGDVELSDDDYARLLAWHLFDEHLIVRSLQKYDNKLYDAIISAVRNQYNDNCTVMCSPFFEALSDAATICRENDIPRQEEIYNRELDFLL